jgi:hypothetical protein
MNPKELREMVVRSSIVGKVSVVGDSILDEVGAMSAIDLADVATAWNALPALLAVYEAAEAMLAEMYPVCGADARAKWIIDGNSTAPASLKAALDAAREAK